MQEAILGGPQLHYWHTTTEYTAKTGRSATLADRELRLSKTAKL